MKLLIGYDGSTHAGAAIRDLRHAGLPERGEALVMSVAELPLGFPGGLYAGPDAVIPAQTSMANAAQTFALDAVATAKQTAGDGVGLVKKMLPGWEVRADTVPDSPYRGLVEMAERWPADLVVLGTEGRGAIGRLVLGSVSQNVLSHAPCSVRIGRARRDENQPLHIMLAFDGSPDAAAAAQAVGSRTWPAGTEVRVVSAVNPQLAIALAASAADRREGHNAGLDEVVETRAKAVVQELLDRGLRATCRMVAGESRRILLEQAEIWSADCIFLGAQGHTRLERFLLGSVSASIAARAGCSVEVVRPLRKI